MTQQASRWAEGDFGEGYATYARWQGAWYSVNGTRPNISEIRWKVSGAKIVQALNDFVNDDDE